MSRVSLKGEEVYDFRGGTRVSRTQVRVVFGFVGVQFRKANVHLPLLHTPFEWDLVVCPMGLSLPYLRYDSKHPVKWWRYFETVMIPEINKFLDPLF